MSNHNSENKKVILLNHIIFSQNLISLPVNIASWEKIISVQYQFLILSKKCLLCQGKICLSIKCKLTIHCAVANFFIILYTLYDIQFLFLYSRQTLFKERDLFKMNQMGLIPPYSEYNSFLIQIKLYFLYR